MPSRTMRINAVFAFLILMLFSGFNYASTSTSRTIKKEYSLKAVQTNVTLPDLSKYPSGTPRKKAFLKAVVPVIEKINRDIMQDRNWLLSMRKNKKWSAQELKRLSNICSQYGIRCAGAKKVNWDKLLSRVDIMPTHFVVTQAATESGWGTSQLAKKNNNIFGMRCGSGCKLNRDKTKIKGYSAYKNMYDSISAYMKNMNTHNAYESLRKSRAQQRKTLNSLNTAKLIGDLKGYSILGSRYNRYLQEMYSSNEKLITQAQKSALTQI